MGCGEIRDELPPGTKPATRIGSLAPASGRGRTAQRCSFRRACGPSYFAIVAFLT